MSLYQVDRSAVWKRFSSLKGSSPENLKLTAIVAPKAQNRVNHVLECAAFQHATRILAGLPISDKIHKVHRFTSLQGELARFAGSGCASLRIGVPRSLRSHRTPARCGSPWLAALAPPPPPPDFARSARAPSPAFTRSIIGPVRPPASGCYGAGPPGRAGVGGKPPLASLAPGGGSGPSGRAPGPGPPAAPLPDGRGG